MSQQPTINCNNIRIMCKMRDRLLIPLYKQRKETENKNLGRIGPAQFQPASEFFMRANSHQIKHTIKPKWKYDNKYCVAIGDIHGDFLALLSVLYMMNIIDEDGYWVGGNTLVVLCGDLLDRSGRGPPDWNTSRNDREEVDILQYLFALNLMAYDKGHGNVAPLLGNHELVRVYWNSVTSTFQKYIGTQYKGYQRSSAESMSSSLFSPGKPLALYLAATMPLVIQCRNFVFMHGGPPLSVIDPIYRKNPANADVVIQILNGVAFDALATKNYNVIPNIVAKIAWDRSYSKYPSGSPEERQCEKNIEEVLHKLGIREPKWGGLVVGHSVQKNGIIVPYCSSKVFRIDVGLSEAFGGKDTKEKKTPISAIRIIQTKLTEQEIKDGKPTCIVNAYYAYPEATTITKKNLTGEPKGNKRYKYKSKSYIRTPNLTRQVSPKLKLKGQKRVFKDDSSSSSSSPKRILR